MQQYLCIHTFTPGKLTREQVEQFAWATQQSEDVHGLRSYVNLTEGRAACIFESKDRGILQKFFEKMGMPVDSITPIEIEGEQGIMHDVAQEATRGTGARPA
jgi:hypothetical protein